jgi:hypothetical protein
MIQLSATIATLCVSLVNFATIILCIAPHRVFIFVVLFRYDSVRKLLDTPSYIQTHWMCEFSFRLSSQPTFRLQQNVMTNSRLFNDFTLNGEVIWHRMS